MKNILNFFQYNKNMIKEINTYHKKILNNNDSNFTLSYELELEHRKGHDSIDDLTNEFKSIFPLFHKKWNNKIDIIPDESLLSDDGKFVDDIDFDNEYFSDDQFLDFDNHTEPLFIGLEVVLNGHHNSLQEGYEYINDFFKDYNKQKKFKFSEKTGLHINIGYVGDNKINLIKGYLMLNEDYALSGWKGRKDSKFAGSFRKNFDIEVGKYLKNNYYDIREMSNHLDKIEFDINNILLKIAKIEDEKSIGFNIHKLDKKYIEFRYGGGKGITENLIKEKTSYYANIVLACYDKNYREKSYKKMFYKFITKQFDNE